jgi:uncharacterized FlgJ-related protein
MKTYLLLFVFLLISATTSTINITTRSITHENFYEKLVEYEIKHPDVVFAQAVLESGNFTSKLFKTQNNLFGMKLPYKRKTTAVGKNKSGYAKYNTIDDSIYDYFLFQEYAMRKREMNKKEYISYIGRNYAHDKFYVQKLNKIIKNHTVILNGY